MLKRTLNRGFLVLLLCLIVSFQTQADHSQTDTQFPNKVVIEYKNQTHDMSLTGLAIRKKFVFDVYSMAHYLEQQSNYSPFNKTDDERYNQLLEQNSAKQISMVFMRSLKAEQIQESLLSGIKMNSSDAEFLSIEPQVKEFMHAINADVKENDAFTLRWLPDGTLVSLFQGKEISAIKSPELAKTMWSIWFSDNSVVDRKSLIEKLLSSS